MTDNNDCYIRRWRSDYFREDEDVIDVIESGVGVKWIFSTKRM